MSSAQMTRLIGLVTSEHSAATAVVKGSGSPTDDECGAVRGSMSGVSTRTASARDRLIGVGLDLLLEKGYHGLGTAEVLARARAPRGSFYHHFADKEDYALHVVDAYMTGVHAALDQCVDDDALEPLQRIRAFFDLVRAGYRAEGYQGCLLGGLGQELASTSPAFAERIAGCLTYIGSRLRTCVELGQQRGHVRADVDAEELAQRLVDCWEGAALRSRLTSSEAPLTSMLDLVLSAVAIPQPTEVG